MKLKCYLHLHPSWCFGPHATILCRRGRQQQRRAARGAQTQFAQSWHFVGLALIHRAHTLHCAEVVEGGRMRGADSRIGGVRVGEHLVAPERIVVDSRRVLSGAQG